MSKQKKKKKKRKKEKRQRIHDLLNAEFMN